MATVGSTLALVTGGIGLAALGASSGVGGIFLGGGVLMLAENGIIMGATATTIVGLTTVQWTLAGLVAGVSTSVLATTLNISSKQAAELQEEVKSFQKDSTLIKPGKKYTWSGSLSLTMTVYAMNSKLQRARKDCYTGATVDSEKLYTISEHFSALDVKKNESDMYTVYKKN